MKKVRINSEVGAAKRPAPMPKSGSPTAGKPANSKKLTAETFNNLMNEHEIAIGIGDDKALIISDHTDYNIWPNNLPFNKPEEQPLSEEGRAKQRQGFLKIFEDMDRLNSLTTISNDV